MNVLDLLSGDAQTFREKVWASRTHLHRTDPELLVGLLTLRDVDRLLTDTALRTPAIRLARDGAVLPESTYTRPATLAGRQLTGLVDPRRVLDLVADGATVVLQGLHRYWPPLARLVAGLERELGHPCQANAYLTPPGAQGFAVHEDSHDVFVFQTHGRKRWELHTVDGVEQVTLEPGLCLYLPSGIPHAARSEESASLHVTVGVNQVTWRDLLRRVAAGVVDAMPDGHLPAGYPDRPDELATELAGRLQELAEAVRRVDARCSVSDQVDRFRTSRNPRLGGALVGLLALPELSDGSALRRRDGQWCYLSLDGDRLRLLLGDRQLSVPAWLRPAVERVLGVDRFTPGELADLLGPRSRLVLCRRLVREGLLEVAG